MASGQKWKELLNKVLYYLFDEHDEQVKDT